MHKDGQCQIEKFMKILYFAPVISNNRLTAVTNNIKIPET